VAGSGRRNSRFHEQYVFRTEAEGDIMQSDEALQQQASAGHQDHGHRNLGGDQCGSQSSGAAAGRTDSTLLERVAEVDARGLDGGSEAKQKTGGNRDQERKRQNSSID